jgi:prevent-host-death family protein
MTNMTRIAVAEAKARFSQLLDRVSRGERFLVLRHGRPAAALVPVGEATDVEPEAESEPRPKGLATLAGALADWEDMEAVMAEVIASRQGRMDNRPDPFADRD